MTKAKTDKNWYHDKLIEELKNPKFVVEYLRAALVESDMPELFLLALRNVAEARGLAKLAKAAHLNRENLYRLLSEKGNPELRSLYAILNALGFRLSIEAKKVS